MVAVGAYAVCFGAMLVLWRLLLSNRAALVLIAVLGLAGRGAMLQYPSSDDLNRYRWEGSIQRYGLNPYETPPASDKLAHLRTGYWSGINHKHLPTIYGPAAQLTFGALSVLADSSLAYKIGFIAFDLGIAVLLLLIVAHYGLPRRHLALYFLNPLVLVFIAGEAHMESMCVFFVVAAMWAALRGREALLFGALGAAVMVKLTPVFLVPFVVRRGNLKSAWAFFVPLLLVVPYADSAVPIWNVPFRFAALFHYNGLVYSLYSLVSSPVTSSILSWATAAVLLSAVFYLTPERVRALFLASGVFLLCTTTLHPWYLLLLTPFLVLYRPPAWIVLHLTVAATFLVAARYQETGVWRESATVLALEYIPFVLAAVFSVFRRGNADPRSYRQPAGVSVIVPVLNERSTIEQCLASLHNQNEPAAEIVVADGGSTDGTVKYTESLADIRLVESPPGRGAQIRQALERVSGDIVLIVHADSRLEPGALASVRKAFAHYPEASGGALGAAFDSPDAKYRLIELLNNVRARLAGVSFGDQGQFFRTQILTQPFPDYVLMEDVELAFRMKEKGAVLFLGGGVRSSVRRWEKKGYALNFMKVVQLTAVFVIMRRFELIRDRCVWFYRKYYGRNYRSAAEVEVGC